MKKVSSVVWQFFDRLEENNRCVAVLCKLCDSEYKYFGNTTNLRAHLIKKHPLQWEFRQNNLDGQKVLEEQPMARAYGEDSTIISETVAPKRKKYISTSNDKNTSFSTEGLENSETENEHVDEDAATLNLVRQMHDNQGSDEEWLEEDYVQLDMFEQTPKKTYRKIKREVVTPTCQSPTLRYMPYSSSKPQKAERIIIEDPKKDEYAVFGEYIANKLRKFKAPRTRGNIQQIITTILWQAEYGLFDDAEAVKRVLMSSMHYSDVDQQSTIHENDMQIPSQHNKYTDKTDETNQSVESDGVPLME
ncbi:hypothetical protein O0L34_g3217 [Tuta absoluta]|nr:hypothetical protein O0L34_g3217 [Tuta absoluta]